MNLSNRFHFTPECIQKKCEEWFGESGGRAHNAFYDVTATALCYFEENKRQSQIVQSTHTEDLDTLIDIDLGGSSIPVASRPTHATIPTPVSKSIYDPNVVWFPISDGTWIPSCSNKKLYKSEPVTIKPDGTIYSVTLTPESKSVYSFKDDSGKKHVLYVGAAKNLLDIQ